MEKYVIGIVGMGMIGNSTAVLCTMHGMKTICFVRNLAKVPTYKAGFDKMYAEMIAQGILTQEQAVFRTACHHPVRFRILFCGQIVNKDPDIRFAAVQNQRFFALDL